MSARRPTFSWRSIPWSAPPTERLVWPAPKLAGMSEPQDPHVLEAGHAPTPFTAYEIRRGCPPGRTVRVLVEPSDGPSSLRMNRFGEGDETGAWHESQDLAADGSARGPVEREWVTWLELQRHASFPADQTVIRPETIVTALGRRECLCYSVVRDGGGTSTFWFDPMLPGMPIRYSSEVDGRQTMVVTLIANDMPA